MNHTKQRDLIYSAVQNSCAHPTADEIFQCVRQTLPNISLGTVYRNLGVLADLNRIRKISVPGGADHFDHMGDWHDHMVCEHCGKMFDIALACRPPLAEQLAAQSGMRITGYSLVASCVCPQCAENKSR